MSSGFKGEVDPSDIFFLEQYHSSASISPYGFPPDACLSHGVFYFLKQNMYSLGS